MRFLWVIGMKLNYITIADISFRRMVMMMDLPGYAENYK